MGIDVSIVAYIAIVGMMIYFLGHSFIKSFFEYKEGLINRLVENGKGEL